MTYAFFPFFSDKRYIATKNSLYNYIIRKETILREIPEEPSGIILELGTGISPISAHHNTVYTDLSFEAMLILKGQNNIKNCVVADASHLPFKDGLFSYVVCSEVLEHLTDDKAVMKEVGRVLEKGGVFILTFPHRHNYFAIDDRYVGHLRRYEIAEIMSLTKEAGIEVVRIRKVLGIIEKLTMITVTKILSNANRFIKKENRRTPSPLLLFIFRYINWAYAFFVRMERLVIPMRYASVILVKAVKN
ncbi:MAG: class I SAM-dependent methyltransferase [Syntrophorhabdaceae bacterium]|nr:class I SAM-dependent methyltransferase [Syntrophorhabdaceae bacterium]